MGFLSFVSNARETELFNSELFSPIFFTANANRNLPNKQILKLAQDERGFIWVGTRGGVFRFDGYGYQKLIPSNPSADLSSIYVRSMIAEGDFLWIGTMSSGAFRVDLRTLHTSHYIHDPENADSLGGNQVNGIEKGPDGHIWFAHSFGLDRLDLSSNEFRHFQSQDKPDDRYHNYLLDLTFDADEKLWLSTAKGLAFFDSISEKFLLFNQKNFPQLSNNKLDGVVIRRLFLASDERLWLATQKQGTYIVEPKKSEVMKLDDSANRKGVVNTSLVEVAAKSGGKRQIWISGMTGIEIRDADSGKLLKELRGNLLNEFGLRGDTVYPIMRSTSGMVWLGVNDFGLQYFNPDTSSFLYLDRFSESLQALFSTFIHKVIPVNEFELLILTEKDAYRLNLLSGALTQFFPEAQSLPKNLAGGIIDKDRAYWLGGGNGDLYRVSSDLKTVIKYELPLTKNEGVFVRNIVEGQQGELWVGSDRGLVRLNLDNMTFDKLKNEDGSPFISFVRNLFVDSNNRLWIGTTSGLGVVEPGDDRVVFYSKEQRTEKTLSHNTIYQVIENQQGTILVFTRSGIEQLITDTKDKKIFKSFAREATKQLNVEDRLLQIDDRRYWLGHQFILDQEGQIISQFGEADGVIKNGRGNDIFKLNSRYIMRVTPGWIMLMDLTTESTWDYQPQTAVTELMISNQTREFDFSRPEIRLTASDDRFSVRFASLDFSDPDSNQYRYKLEGYDKEWISTPFDIRQAKYTSLPPGRYELLLQGSNRNGIWPVTSARIEVTVEPKYYQTLWFMLLVLLSVSFLFYGLLRWRLAVVKAKQMERFEKKEAIQRAEMMTELMDQKNKMLAEVTHDLRTPLATVKVQLEALQDGVLKADEKTYETLQNRIANLSQLVSDLYQLSLTESSALVLNKVRLSINHLLEDMVTSFRPMFQQKFIELEFLEKTKSELYILADQGRLSQVIGNLLKNSYRYTDSGGRVNVLLASSKQYIKVIIEDSEPGISEDELNKIFDRLYRADSARGLESSGSGLGLWICQSIIQAHDGEIKAKLSPMGGLSITIELPRITEKQNQ
nr:ATP-binding protein [Aliikangiella sp. G2MR2-5]